MICFICKNHINCKLDHFNQVFTYYQNPNIFQISWTFGTNHSTSLVVYSNLRDKEIDGWPAIHHSENEYHAQIFLY